MGRKWNGIRGRTLSMAPSSSTATRSAIRSNGVSGQLVTARLNQRVELPHVEGHAAEPRQPHRVEMAGVHEAPDTPHAHAEVLGCATCAACPRPFRAFTGSSRAGKSGDNRRARGGSTLNVGAPRGGPDAWPVQLALISEPPGAASATQDPTPRVKVSRMEFRPRMARPLLASTPATSGAPAPSRPPKNSVSAMP